jgi:hypothetical protein
MDDLNDELQKFREIVGINFGELIELRAKIILLYDRFNQAKTDEDIEQILSTLTKYRDELAYLSDKTDRLCNESQRIIDGTNEL